MERVTYILGAGFSAPLGLPVMRNFLIKSKDMYFADPTKYQHFNDVFKTIDKMSSSKNYYDTDLFNIEEILSIIEMNDFVKKRHLKEEFSRYICDVIQHYTPPIKGYEGILPANWPDWIFGGTDLQRYFGYFVGNLVGLEFEMRDRPLHSSRGLHPERSLQVRRAPNDHVRYAVITLNYDLVLENVCGFLKQSYITSDDISFNKDNDPGDWLRSPLAKLHGSVDSGYVVPPTWAKGTHRRIASIWRNAYKILVESNHIRFIGYSLPVADAYIKYLLKASVIHSRHLKSIDVICLDHDGSAKRRYDDFLKFSYYRFANADVRNYVHQIFARTDRSRGGEVLYMKSLEDTHDVFMNVPAMWRSS